MNSRPIIFLFLALASPAMAKPPNIVLILADDLGYGDLSSYGAEDLKSPEIDALMGAGIRFDQFYANCPVCSPSRASILTGLYPEMAGVPGVIRTPRAGEAANWGKLKPGLVTLPAELSQAGYRTAIIGKWHLGLDPEDRPNARGFDFFQGFLGDMMDDYYDHRRWGVNYMRKDGEVIDPEGHATDLFSDWAVEFIGKQDREEPFFLYLAYNAPHTPIQPPADWLAKVKAREPGIGEARAKLVALIEHLDAGIGRVVAALKATGAYEDTVIVFTSDNGGQTTVGARNAPWSGGKQEMFEGGIRVPTCVVWPGTVAAGRVDGKTVSLGMDLFPTLVEVAGLEVGRAVDGRSFLPLLRGEEFEDEPRDLFWVRLEGNDKYGGIPYHAARRGKWKLLRNDGFGPYALYDLESDPAEGRPLARKDEPQAYRELFGALMMHINRAGQVPWQRDEP